MSAPFIRREHSVPVTVVTDPAALAQYAEDGAVQLLRLEPPQHAHAPGTSCVACDARGDIRVLLFDLDEKLRRGVVPPFARVVVDASGIADVTPVANALIPGRLPALGLRDHAVARNFHLEEVIPASS